MSRLAADLWERLASAAPKGVSLTARRAAPDATERLLVAIDADGRRHLLVQLAADDEVLHDRRSRGVSVITRELEIPGSDMARYIDLTCLDPGGHDAFDLLGGELVLGIVAGRGGPAVLVSQVLSKWRRFWGQAPRDLLSREAQIGLCAELNFLVRWLLPATSCAIAVRRWRGPYRARHDFEWRGRAVEAKASTTVGRAVFRVHGLDQLDPPEEGDLLLYALHLREEGGADLTLPGLVAEVSQALRTDGSALAVFEESLAEAGYSPLHQDEYAAAWRIVDERLYPVVPGFPRLAHESLLGGLPPGVGEVAYSIDLSGYAGTMFTAPSQSMSILS